MKRMTQSDFMPELKWFRDAMAEIFDAAAVCQWVNGMPSAGVVSDLAYLELRMTAVMGEFRELADKGCAK